MAYSQLKTFTEPFSILINLRDNRYRCLDLTDPRTTTAARTTSTSVPAPSSHQVTAVTNKVNRLLTLSRVCSWRSSTFRGLVTLAANDQGPSTPVHWSYPPCRPVAIPLAGTVGSPDFLPLRTPVGSSPYH